MDKNFQEFKQTDFQKRNVEMNVDLPMKYHNEFIEYQKQNLGCEWFTNQNDKSKLTLGLCN